MPWDLMARSPLPSCWILALPLAYLLTGIGLAWYALSRRRK